MPRCSIFGCRTGYKGEIEKFRCFKLPKSRGRLAQWLEKINRADFIPSEHSHVCERHFVAKDFVPANENLELENPV